MLKLFKLLLVLILIFPGCATQTTTFQPMPKPSGLAGFNSIESAISHYFTPEACQVINDIPLLYGHVIVPFVSGVNVWSNIASFLSFNWWGRQVIISKNYMLESRADNSLVHEYMHHIDDMDRDGLIDLIDHKEFEHAYRVFSADEQYKNDYEAIRLCSDRFITNTFGVGYLSEEIAYVAGWMAATGEGPDYLWHVYSRILIRPIAKVQSPVAHK